MKHAITFCLSILLLGLLIGPIVSQEAFDTTPDASRQITDLEKQVAELDPKAKPSAETLDLYSRLGRLYLDADRVEEAVKAYAEGGKIEAQLGTNPGYIPNAASQVLYLTQNKVQAFELLLQAPIENLQTAQVVVEWVMSCLPEYKGTAQEKRPILDKGLDLFTRIASIHKDQPIADDAEWAAVGVRSETLRLDADEGKITQEDVRQREIEMYQEFIDQYPQSKMLSKARYNLGMQLQMMDDANFDVNRTAKLFQSVIDDPAAGESEKVESASMLVRVFVRADRRSEAETAFANLRALNDNEKYDSQVVGALLELRKIQKSKGDTNNALQDEAKALAAKGEADFALRIGVAHQMVYEVESGRMKVSAGSGCRVYHTAQVEIMVAAAKNKDFPYAIRFTSPKPMSGKAQGKTMTTEVADSLGCHLRYEDVVAGDRWGYVSSVNAEIKVEDEKQFANLPLKDVSIAVSSEAKGDGMYVVTIVVDAPLRSRLRVYATSDEAPGLKIATPCGVWESSEGGFAFMDKEGEGWSELPPIDRPGEVTYTFTFEGQEASSSFVPRLELRIPTSEYAKPTQPPTTGTVTTEVSGTLGDIKYGISSTERFKTSDWRASDETVIVIPESSR